MRIVTIAVPPELQPEIAIAAARAGKAIFCEKPLAARAADASAIAREASAAGVVGVVDFEFPESAAWKRTRELVRSGELGPIRQVHIDWRVRTRPRADSWKDREGTGGGVIGGFVSHSLYHLEWLVDRIVDLKARARTTSTDDAAYDIWLRLAGGEFATISVATDIVGGPGHRIEICGENATLVLENPSTDHAGPFALVRSEAAHRRTVVVDGGAGSFLDRRAALVASLAARFVDAFRSGGPVEPSLASGARVQELLDAVRTSAGRAVTA